MHRKSKKELRFILKFYIMYKTFFRYRNFERNGGERIMKMTLQTKKRQRSKVHGFRARMSSAGGRKVLAARRAKGRAKLTV